MSHKHGRDKTYLHIHCCIDKTLHVVNNLLYTAVGPDLLCKGSNTIMKPKLWKRGTRDSTKSVGQGIGSASISRILGYGASSWVSGTQSWSMYFFSSRQMTSSCLTFILRVFFYADFGFYVAPILCLRLGYHLFPSPSFFLAAFSSLTQMHITRTCSSQLVLYRSLLLSL